MKNIIIVATGGTIAGSGKVGKATNYQAGKINIKEIIDSIPMINEVANLKAIQLFNVDSNEMNEEHWIILANKINDLASQKNVDGIVVTHGTDTLDETAYFLNLTINTYKPVVLTDQRVQLVQMVRLIYIKLFVWLRVMMLWDMA